MLNSTVKGFVYSEWKYWHSSISTFRQTYYPNKCIKFINNNKDQYNNEINDKCYVSWKSKTVFLLHMNHLYYISTNIQRLQFRICDIKQIDCHIIVVIIINFLISPMHDTDTTICRWLCTFWYHKISQHLIVMGFSLPRWWQFCSSKESHKPVIIWKY